jgi:hypothetical protein
MMKLSFRGTLLVCILLVLLCVNVDIALAKKSKSKKKRKQKKYRNTAQAMNEQTFSVKGHPVTVKMPDLQDPEVGNLI